LCNCSDVTNECPYKNEKIFRARFARAKLLHVILLTDTDTDTESELSEGEFEQIYNYIHADTQESLRGDGAAAYTSETEEDDSTSSEDESSLRLPNGSAASLKPTASDFRS